MISASPGHVTFFTPLSSLNRKQDTGTQYPQPTREFGVIDQPSAFCILHAPAPNKKSESVPGTGTRYRYPVPVTCTDADARCGMRMRTAHLQNNDRGWSMEEAVNGTSTGTWYVGCRVSRIRREWKSVQQENEVLRSNRGYSLWVCIRNIHFNFV